MSEDLQFVIAVGSLALAAMFGISLARHNLKMMSETKQERLEARRAYKRKKNIALARFYGIKDYKPKD